MQPTDGRSGGTDAAPALDEAAPASARHVARDGRTDEPAVPTVGLESTVDLLRSGRST